MTPPSKSIVYLDTSAAAKLVIREKETDALRDWLAGVRAISSALMETELLRAVRRHRAAAIDQARQLVASVGLIPVDALVLARAAILGPPILRTLHAIHLATALTLDLADLTMVTYDERLADATGEAGLSVARPE